jgi:peptidyl-prolyl cis-trans isomerase A (cyclophilin A)
MPGANRAFVFLRAACHNEFSSMRTALLFLLAAFCAFPQEPKLPNGLYAVFTTFAGTFTAKLLEKDTPESVRTFVGLAQGTKPWKDPRTGKMVTRPLYDNLLFYRSLSGEMIQSGSPTGTTAYDCGFTIRDEFLPGLRFDLGGKLAMANAGNDNTGGCQFFITLGPMPRWNGKYAIFGNVVQGMDVVEKINHLPAHGEEPVHPAKLINVAITRVGPEPRKR